VGTSRIAVSAAAPDGSPAHEETGKYLVVFKRTGNDWKVAYAIYNDDAPRPGGPPTR
jgi:ketosteroid isomerase-like protein